ncbi:MAG: N-acetylneuraminate synthase family protein [Bradymonadaceae bacterium]
MLLVAEIGLNHEGNFDMAYELIRQASLSGADIAKFQFGWRSSEGELNHITPRMAHRLKDWCDFWEVDFMASIISEEALELIRPLNPKRYKIASRTVVDKPDLVKRVLDQGKETFVSLGFWNEDGYPFGLPDEDLRYIFCRSIYPTYPGDLKDLPHKFSESAHYGYSDHMHGIEGCLLALSRGARFIEKHFTLDKTIQSVHRDHILSATPDELRMLSDIGRPLARLAGVVDEEIQGIKGVPQ